MKTINYIILLFAASLVITGCDDFLDEPKSKSSSFVPETTDNLEALLNDYSQYSQERNTIALYGTDDFDLDAGLYTASSSAYDPSQVQYGIWDVDNLAMDDRPFWNDEFKKIFNANMIIEYIGEVSGEEATKEILKQEAHFLRAYSYYNLVNTYCLPYSDANKSELGLPIESSTEFSETGERVSLEETYEFIKNDLDIALELDVDLEVVNNKNRTWRASRPAVNAFAARFYLNMHDYENAQKYAEAALAEHNTLIDYNTDMRYSDRPYFGFVNGVQTPIEMPYTADQQLDPTDRMEWKELYYYRFLSNPRWFNMPTDDLLNTYDQVNDLRYRYHVVENYSYYRRHNYDQPGFIHFFLDDVPNGPTVAEMILIKAECQIRKGQYVEGIATVNELRVARMDNTADPATIEFPVPATQAEALSNVLEERRREMAFKTRWFDIRRYNSNGDTSDDVTITKTFFEVSSSAILGGAGVPTRTYTLEPGSRRYAVPIPQSEIINTRGILKQNTY